MDWIKAILIALLIVAGFILIPLAIAVLAPVLIFVVIVLLVYALLKDHKNQPFDQDDPGP